MELEAILHKLGVQVTSQKATAAQIILLLRVAQGDLARHRWRSLIEEILLRELGDTQKDGKKPWTLDLSQWYFLDAATRSPRYAWRMVIGFSGKKGRDLALKRFRDAALQSLASGVEVTEMPLVGRVDYNNPNGTRGVYGVGSEGGSVAGSLISRQNSGGLL